MMRVPLSVVVVVMISGGVNSLAVRQWTLRASPFLAWGVREEEEEDDDDGENDAEEEGDEKEQQMKSLLSRPGYRLAMGECFVVLHLQMGVLIQWRVWVEEEENDDDDNDDEDESSWWWWWWWWKDGADVYEESRRLDSMALEAAGRASGAPH